MNESLGQRIARLRKEQSLTQEELGNKLNISSQAVSKWENDLTSPDISSLVLLSDILKVTVDELLGKKTEEVVFTPVENKKDVSKMILKIIIDGSDGDKVKVNIPVSFLKLCLEIGLSMPEINGKDYLKDIDLNQVFLLIDQGVSGKIVEIESADGDIISVVVE